MIKVYSFALCALVCAGTASAAGRFAPRKAHGAMAPFKVTASQEALGDVAELWKPGRVTEYLCDDGEFVELGTAFYVYDENGNVISETLESEDYKNNYKTKYDEFGNAVEVLGTVYTEYDDVWENMSLRTYTYDDVLHDFYTLRMGYDWDGEKWVPNYLCERNDIVRNAAGSIVSVTKYLPFGEDMIPAYRLSWGYGEDGKANSMVYYANYTGTEDGWEVYDDTEYRDIKWAETDCQMIASSIVEYLEGANRIESATVYFEGVADGYMFVDYDPAKPGDYLCRMTYADPDVIGATLRKEYTDAYGSFVETVSEYYDEEGEPTGEPQYEIRHVVTYNEKGGLLDDSVYEGLGDEFLLMDGMKNEYVYDAAGHVAEITTYIWDFMEEEFVPDMRQTFGDYTEVTSVGMNPADDAPEVYYDLTGRRIGNPVNGLYIRVKGFKAEKVILK